MNLTAEHIHLMFNHMPIIGLAAAAIALGVAIALPRRELVLAALGLALVFSAPIPLVMWSGEAAHDRAEDGALLPPFDEAGKEIVELHYERAELISKAVYATAGLSALAIGLALLRPKASERARRVGTSVVLVGCLLSVGGAAWVANSGGKIRHPELRAQNATPDAAALAGQGNDDDD